MITLDRLGLCPWCARKYLTHFQDGGTRTALPCGHPLPSIEDVELHRIELPYPNYPRYPDLSLNSRSSRFARNSDTQNVRSDVARLARSIKPGRHLFAHLAWSPTRPSTRRDVDNLGQLYKVICDALARGPRRPTLRNPGVAIGLDLVPDDDTEHFTKIMPVVLPPGDDPPGMTLTVGIFR